MMMVGHLKNFWDLSDDASLELGLSGINGDEWIRGNVYHLQEWTLRINENLCATTPITRSRFRSRYSAVGRIPEGQQLRPMDCMPWPNTSLPVGGLQWVDSTTQTCRTTQIGMKRPFLQLWDGISANFKKLEWGARHSWGPDLDASWQGLVRAIFVIGTHGRPRVLDLNNTWPDGHHGDGL